MALKTLIFGTDDLYPVLKPYYEREVQRGNIEIVAYAVFENGTINLVDAEGKRGGADDSPTFELAIISSKNDFYQRMKFLAARGFPRSQIIDGRVFPIKNLDFAHLIEEDVAYGTWSGSVFPEENISRFTIYKRIYINLKNSSIIKLGIKSAINGAYFDGGEGTVTVGNFSSISWNETFGFYDGGHNPAYGHHLEYVSMCDLATLDWEIPFTDLPQKQLQIQIGNDVWIGRGCNLKCTNPNKPLIIGDGAVIASDSVVVKSVPPYAIVGGNPAQIIKYRFPPDVIESMLRIKWWDWDIDKIHDNFKYFNDIEKFISLHDRS